MKLLLEGSRGKIGLAILVKLDALEPGETSLQRGFVQVYTYDYEKEQAAILGERMVRLYCTFASWLAINKS